MADAKISALMDGTTPDDADDFVVARAGSTLKLTWAALKAAIGGSTPITIDIPDGSTNAITVHDVDAATVFTMGPGGEVVMHPDKNESSSLDTLELRTQDHSAARSLTVYNRAGDLCWVINAEGQIDTVSGGTVFDPSGHINVALSSDSGFAEAIEIRAVTEPADSSDGNAVTFRDSIGTLRARVMGTGAFVTRQHAAPADALLAAGDLAIWFDQTDGAAKLMLKGKSADGTVVTGNVVLS